MACNATKPAAAPLAVNTCKTYPARFELCDDIDGLTPTTLVQGTFSSIL